MLFGGLLSLPFLLLLSSVNASREGALIYKSQYSLKFRL